MGRTGGMPGPRLCLLSRPRVQLPDGREIDLSPLDAALLAVLALDRELARERVLALFWPDEPDDSRARNALRQRLFKLRRKVGPGLLAQGDTLTLGPGVRHDLMIRDVEHGRAAAPGDLLGSMSLDAHPAAADWLDTARRRWRERQIAAWRQQAGRLEAAARLSRALAVARHLVDADPVDEDAARCVMRLRHRCGQGAEARAVHLRLQRALRALDPAASPSRSTLELLASIEGDLAAGREGGGPLAPQVELPRLIGREHVWPWLTQAAAAGVPALLRGAPGMGKTRLLGAWAQAPRRLMIGARPGDGDWPYALLARLVRAMARLPGAAEDMQPMDKAELARWEPAFGPPAAGPMQPQRVLATLQRALPALGIDVLGIDDLQFADDASVLLLGALVQGLPGCVLAARPGPGGRAWHDWLERLSEGAGRVLDLDPLSDEQSRELLLALSPDADTGWAASLASRSGGNPLWLLEARRACPPGSAATEGAAHGAGLQRLITDRLTGLSESARQLARLACVAGPDFGVDIAAAVLQVKPLDLHDAMRELEQQQVMQGLALAHDAIDEALRAELPQALAGWMHARVAAALEQATPSAAHRLAFHWAQAGRPALAATAYERAAEGAAAAGRLAEQARWLADAAQGWQRAGQQAREFQTRRRLALAVRESGSAAQAIEAAQALLAAAVDPAQRAQALVEQGACCLIQARFAQADTLFARALEQAREAGDGDTEHHAAYLQAMAQAQTRGLAVALKRMESLRPWAAAHADVSLRHSFLADLAIVLDQADRRHEAGVLFEQVLAFFDARHETGNSAPARALYGRSLMMLGRLPAAFDQLQRASRDRAVAAAGGVGHGIERLNLARVQLELGHYRELIEGLQPMLEQQGDEGSDVVRGAMALVVARAQWHLGQHARALPLLRLVPDDAPSHQRAMRLWTQGQLASAGSIERSQLLEQAVQAVQDQADLPFLRLPMQFDHWAGLEGPQALKAMRSGVAECERRELLAPQMLGRLRLLQCLLRCEQIDDALTVGRDLAADLARRSPVSCYLPEMHLTLWRVGRQAGDTRLAADMLDAGLRWIANVADHHLPPLGREAFLQRNPVNRELLAAAGR